MYHIYICICIFLWIPPSPHPPIPPDPAPSPICPFRPPHVWVLVSETVLVPSLYDIPPGCVPYFCHGPLFWWVCFSFCYTFVLILLCFRQAYVMFVFVHLWVTGALTSHLPRLPFLATPTFSPSPSSAYWPLHCLLAIAYWPVARCPLSLAFLSIAYCLFLLVNCLVKPT